MITLRLLGPIEIFVDESPVKVDSRKALALLSYLVLARRPLSRAHLLGMLWADMPEDRARANLSWTLNRLHSLLPGVLHAERASIRYTATASVLVDVHAWERLAQATDEDAIQTALELHRGPLLDGLEMQGCAEFEHWLQAERSRYEQGVLTLMQRLADLQSARGSYAEAADTLNRLLALDPLREEVHRQRMQMLAHNNQRSAALAQFEQCRRVLHDELGVEPEAATLALVEQIRRGALERGSARKAQSVKREEPSEAEKGEKSPVRQPNSDLRVANGAPLIGRDVELGEVDGMLRDPASRLVTIGGFGGMGKTRLALAAAERAARHFRNGAAVVALTTIDTAALMPIAIGDALQIDLRSQIDPRRRLIELLREREQLLVLDNIEHVLDGVELVSDILAEAPHVRLLVTSQVRLGLADEWVFDLRGLRLPAGDDVEAVEQSDAVQLFVRQARRVQTSFALDGTNRTAVVRICRAVWGHPLAIEVAASWVRTLSPAEIAAEIEAGAGLLTATVRDKPARHRSAQSVFSYGWARLSTEEQQAFALLSVFPSDFSRDAANALLQPLTGGDEAAALSLVAALVDKSLLRRLRNGRYVLHNLLRRFAARKLRLEEAEAAHARHWRFFAELLRSHENDLRGANQEQALAAINAEFANIRAGWLWASRQPSDALVPAIDSMLLFYDIRGWFRAGAELFRETVGQLMVIQPGSPLLGKVRAREGMLLLWLGEYAAAQSAFVESRAIAHAHADAHEQAFAQAGYGFTLRWLGNLAEAEHHVQAALEQARTVNDRWLVATALQYLALVCRDLGRHAEARAFALECRALFSAIGYRRGIGFALCVLGLVAQDLEQYAEAKQQFNEGLAICAVVGDPMGVVIAEHYLGRLELLQHHYAKARSRFERAQTESHALGYQWGVIRAQTQLAILDRTEGQHAKAEERLTAALLEAQQIGATPLEREITALLHKDEG